MKSLGKAGYGAHRQLQRLDQVGQLVPVYVAARAAAGNGIELRVSFRLLRLRDLQARFAWRGDGARIVRERHPRAGACKTDTQPINALNNAFEQRSGTMPCFTHLSASQYSARTRRTHPTRRGRGFPSRCCRTPSTRALPTHPEASPHEASSSGGKPLARRPRGSRTRPMGENRKAQRTRAARVCDSECVQAYVRNARRTCRAANLRKTSSSVV